MESQVGRYHDDALQAWVDAVARRIETQQENAQFSYRYAVLDQPEPNAFAAPGGFVFVSRGLLATANSEDEIACVLGHEMTHVEQRHAARMQQPRPLTALLTAPGKLIGALAPDVGQAVNAPIRALEGLSLARYGRSQESESDRRGQTLAAAAGYDPAAMAGILGRMARVVRAMTGTERVPSYFDTHPPTPNRVADVLRRASTLAVAPRSPDALDDAAYLRALDGLVWGDNPAHGVFDGDRLLDPLLGVAITFPAEWQQIRTATFAGAARADGEAAVLFSVPAATAQDARQRMADVESALQSAGYTIESDERVESNGREMRLVEFRKANADQVVLQAWVRIANVYGEFVAIGGVTDLPALERAVTSVRDLGDDERRSIRVTRIRIETARSGDTLARLHARVASAGSVELVAALNGLEPDLVLRIGQPVKVLRVEAYP